MTLCKSLDGPGWGGTVEEGIEIESQADSPALKTLRAVGSLEALTGGGLFDPSSLQIFLWEEGPRVEPRLVSARLKPAYGRTLQFIQA